MYGKYIDSIMKNDLFKGIAKEAIMEMLACLQPAVYKAKKNDFIAMTGSSFNGIGIILHGEAIVIKENAAGKRVVMTYLMQGDMYGEMFAFSSLEDWPVSVQALSDCVVIQLSKGKIIGTCDHACSWHQSLIMNLMSIISEKALFLNKKVEYLSIKSMRGKLGKYFLEQSKRAGSNFFILPMNRGELADFLNVSRPSMSREMGRMRDEGVIEFHRSAVKIIDMEALKDMLED